MEPIDVTDVRTIRAIAHPMRQRILAILEEREATSGELAKEMGVSSPALGYHLGALVAAKLIEPIDTGPPRGPRGQRYRRRGTPNIPERVWKQLPDRLKRQIISVVLTQIDTEVRSAAEIGGFLAPDCRVHRVNLTLDEQARAAIATELDALDRRIRELQAESRQRLDQAQGAPIATMAVLMLFERSAGHDAGPTVP